MDPGKVMDKIENEVKKLENEDEDVFLDQDNCNSTVKIWSF